MFFSDLDRTLIFSKAFTAPEGVVVLPVEKKLGKYTSHMTADAHRELQDLKKANLFVPVTTRTGEQAMRINFIRDSVPEWMICEAGRVIYHYGRRFMRWDNELIGTLRNIDMEVYDRFRDMTRELGHPAWSINEYMRMTKVTQWEGDSFSRVNAEIEWFSKRNYDLIIQERKIYLTPKKINKGAAVRYLIKHLGITESVSSGDADMDYGMFKETTSYIAPKHNTIIHDVEHVTDKTGYKSAEEIILFAKSKLMVPV